MSQEAEDALQKFNAEAIQKFKSTKNLHEINFLHDIHENTQDNSTTSNQDDEFPDCQESHPDQDLEPPMDDLLDFINSQKYSDDKLDQVLQTYQTYTESQSPTRQVNALITYHLAQADQAMNQSFVDRGANNRKCSKLTLSKAPCLVALNMYLTLHLLLVWQLKQSM